MSLFIMGDFWKGFLGVFFKELTLQLSVAKANKQKVKIILKFLGLIHNKYSANSSQVLKDY